MKVEDKYFKIEKFEKYLKEDVFTSRYLDIVNIADWQIYETDAIDAPKSIDDLENIEFSRYELGNKWGRFDKTAWFKSKFTIPEKFENKDLLFYFNLGEKNGSGSTAEGLLYINGKFIQAIDVWHMEAKIDSEILKKENEVHIKTWSGVLDPPPYRLFKTALVANYSREVYDFYYKANTLIECHKQLDINSMPAHKIVSALEKSFKKIEFLNYKSREYYDSITLALKELEQQMSTFKDFLECKPTVYGIGHSHLDLGWLWRTSQTREKSSRTFATMLNLMRQHEDFIYMHTSPWLYEKLEEDYPQIYNEVKEKIKEGQWEINGGMWVESDTYIPSGESLVRQFLYGQRYIKKITGKYSDVLWLPDVFGYSSVLPQLMNLAEIKTFMTTKISWNQYNNLENDTFYWYGNDNSKILTHFITTPEKGSWFYTYNGQITPGDVTGIYENYRNSNINTDLLLSYGWGDGGGGPTEEMIENVKNMNQIVGIPNTKYTTVSNYFERLHNNLKGKSVPEYRGELYFEYHRGTLTSQGFIKKRNKEIEYRLKRLESINTLIYTIDKGKCESQMMFYEIYKTVLLFQFHDILPGTSIKEVYEDCENEYIKLNKQLDSIEKKLISKLNNLLSIGENGYIFINTLGFNADLKCKLEYENDMLVSFRGKEIESSYYDGKLHFNLNNMDYLEYRVIELHETKSRKNETDNFKFQNKYLTVQIDKNTGLIKSMKNNQSDFEYVNNSFNKLVAYEDKPLRFDAWDLDVFHKEKTYEINDLISITDESNGGAQIAEICYKFNNSTIKQKIILENNSKYIEFKTNVDWNEERIFLKALFNTNFYESRAFTQTQYGYTERPTHQNTLWDFAMFEVSGHHYSAIQSSGSTLYLLSDCKYGYNFENNIMGISLIKSAIKPDPTADKGTHEFRYAVGLEEGDIDNIKLTNTATEFSYTEDSNYYVTKNNETNVPIEFKLLNDNFIIDAYKISENNNSIIIRIYQPNGYIKQSDTLVFNKKVKSIVRTNILEDEIEEIATQSNNVEITLGKFELITLKINL